MDDSLIEDPASDSAGVAGKSEVASEEVKEPRREWPRELAPTEGGGGNGSRVSGGTDNPGAVVAVDADRCRVGG